ncbi:MULTISPECIES: efflux RND transporter periplasmic adaptor subunit [Pseudomonas syringae group]|uniref:efflux RND transporter periplasmic adaptor subunit n=1 Tax=Pseudomonas syringae group TaxID=136849 RepID=UPI000F01076F|nr:efflux RND transporter periplasmic adaptor subunit [Pseudomonas viridiflava]MCF9021416.1 efflux RND transporter periplasmic adaptor subunit [Pseudomonas syringae]MBI6576173.1 efflux RND transporter periplasmic adaptor subunit [Pseudomonas viridiflava]MBI6608262.1 efflux RND transporter periplasmic adaptor subunit [Pseudomonas viridiflava]MBI6637842.1 efflux RND transporter periplasmic adaptor subunit [Pseudomonas viridiflava]MBI6704719.1 efflux RND transporter periplasmic adaptor subunit [P
MCSVFLCRRHVMAAFLSISVLTGCGKPPGGPPPAPGTPEVGILAVQAQRVVFSTELPGRTAPFMIAEIRPQVSGIVQKRSFTEGSTVKAGQVLYLIDPATYRATYNSDLAALAKAEASLTSVRLKNERYKELAALDAVSRQDYDDAVSSLGESRADVASAKANVESSRINLAYTQVNAPITGRIGKSGITPGALVTANQTSTMATIQQLDPIYVDVTQPSAALLRLKKSLSNGEIQKSGATAAKVRLKLEDGSLYPLEGTLEFSDVTVDQDTGAITLRAVFPNPNADLLPGMYVRAVLEEGFKEQGLLVPQQAVSRDSTGKPMAYVVGKDNTLERRELTTDRAIGDQWLISSGLNVGDQLVVDGQQRASAGVKVKTVPWKPQSVAAVATPSDLQ